LPFREFSKKQCVKFCNKEEGVFAFLIVNFKKKLFSYFEILESSIFLLIILVVFNFIFYVGGGVGVLVLWILRVFCFTILKF